MSTINENKPVLDLPGEDTPLWGEKYNNALEAILTNMATNEHTHSDYAASAHTHAYAPLTHEHPDLVNSEAFQDLANRITAIEQMLFPDIYSLVVGLSFSNVILSQGGGFRCRVSLSSEKRGISLYRLLVVNPANNAVLHTLDSTTSNIHVPGNTPGLTDNASYVVRVEVYLINGEYVTSNGYTITFYTGASISSPDPGTGPGSQS